MTFEAAARRAARVAAALLGWRPDNPTRFAHDAARPLVADVLLIDEVSMVDATMMARLLEATPPGCRLLLLGDREQLPSVEAGAVLADLGAGLGGAKRVSGAFADQLAGLAGLDLRAAADPSVVVVEGELPALHDATVQLTVSQRFGAQSGIGRFARAAIAGAVDEALGLLRAGVPGSLAGRSLEASLDEDTLQIIIHGVETPEGRRGGYAHPLRTWSRWRKGGEGGRKRPKREWASAPRGRRRQRKGARKSRVPPFKVCRLTAGAGGDALELRRGFFGPCRVRS
jgi:exodeoxyribonuclease V alpha subunit